MRKNLWILEKIIRLFINKFMFHVKHLVDIRKEKCYNL